MKKIISIFVLCFVALSFNSFSQVKVGTNGYVGINQSHPAHNLDCYGTGRFITTWGQLLFDSSGPSGAAILYPNDDWVGNLGKSNKRFNEVWCYTLHYDNLYDWSDERLKEDIKQLESSLDKILKLNGVSYKMKKEFYRTEDSNALANIMKNQKKDFGFIAQEVNEIIPEVVSLDSASNYYSVNYVKLIPLLTEALKEQQYQIDDLAKKLYELQENCCSQNLKSASISTSTSSQIIEEIASLDQNIPNPFTQTTRIRCFIPKKSNSANLYIYNMQGIQLQQHKIIGTGNKIIEINSNSLKAGIFLYSLIVDGKEIDTKRMILTK